MKRGFAGVFALVVSSSAWGATGWRNDGSGIYAATPPSTFSTASAAWSTAMPATGNATPVVVGNKVCVTAEPTTLLCADAATGRVLWSRSNDFIDAVSEADKAAWKAFLDDGEAAVKELATVQSQYSSLQREARRSAGDPAIYQQLEQLVARMDGLRARADAIKDYRTPSDKQLIGYASATPVSDGTYIYAKFGNGVVSKFDLSGNRQWSVWLGAHNQEMRGFHTGTTASPVLAGDVLVVPYGQLHGLDLRNGGLRWSGGKYSDYGTPALANVGGTWVAFTPDGQMIATATGAVLKKGMGDVWYSSPVVAGNEVFWFGSTVDAHTQSSGGITCSGWRLSGGGGSVTATPLWNLQYSYTERFYSTPVVKDGMLYSVSRWRTLLAVRTSDGAVVWEHKLEPTLTGETWPNLTITGDKLWVSTDRGEMAAVRLGSAFELIGKSELEPMLSTPAFVGGNIYVRTFKRLMAIR